MDSETSSIEISPDETSARFLNEESKVRKRPLGVKPKAFAPSAKHGNTLSICLLLGRPPAEIARIGLFVTGGRLYGWAELPVAAFLENALVVIRDDANYKGHANVSGFPEDSAALLDVLDNLAAASAPRTPEDWKRLLDENPSPAQA